MKTMKKDEIKTMQPALKAPKKAHFATEPRSPHPPSCFRRFCWLWNVARPRPFHFTLFVNGLVQFIII